MNRTTSRCIVFQEDIESGEHPLTRAIQRSVAGVGTVQYRELSTPEGGVTADLGGRLVKMLSGKWNHIDRSSILLPAAAVDFLREYESAPLLAPFRLRPFEFELSGAYLYNEPAVLLVGPAPDRELMPFGNDQDAARWQAHNPEWDRA